MRKTSVTLSIDELVAIRTALGLRAEDGAYDPDEIGDDEAAKMERLIRKVERAIGRAR